MRLTRKCLGFAVVLTFLLNSAAWAGLGSNKTMYVGGTIAALKPGEEGTSSTQDEKVFEFKSKNENFSIPYDKINDLEYGQKAGRRLALALTISPWLLLSHKRKHFLTIGYTDANNAQQAGVFELGEGHRSSNVGEPRGKNRAKN